MSNLSATEASKPELHVATFAVCFILLVPIIILGTSANVVAILRIMRVPRVRKTYSTIIHLLFLAAAACGFVCPLELVQLLENYFQVGLMSTCDLKLFLRVLLQVSSFTCSVVIAWERMQKIRGHTQRYQRMCHKYLIFSFMWLLIIPYALYNMVHSMYQDVPQLLVQVCHLKHVVRVKISQAAHQHLLPLLFLVSLITTGIIYKQGCLKAEAQHEKTTANKNNRPNPFAMLKRPAESCVLSQSADMFSVGNKDLDLSPKLPHRNGDNKPHLDQNSTMNIHPEQRENSYVLDPTTVEHESPQGDSNGIGSPTETDRVASLETDPPQTGKVDSSTESAFRKSNIKTLGPLPEGQVSTILEIPRAADEICLKPLRHTRLSAGSSWKTVRDAFESNRIKTLGKGSDNKVKCFKSVLNKSDSSWSLASFMEPTESPLSMKKRFRSRKKCYRNSQKWQLESISAEVDTMTEFNSNAVDNTLMPEYDDDLANMKLAKSEYKHLPAETKRNVFKSLKSDIPVAWRSQLQINTSILRCEQTPTEKIAPENLGQPDPRATEEAFCAEQDGKCADAMNQGSVNVLVENIQKITGNNNSHIISAEMDEIHADSGDTFKTDQQENCKNVPSMKIIRPSTDTEPRTSQICVTDPSSNIALMPSSQSSLGGSYQSRFQPAHSKRNKAIWTKATVTTVINRSLLLVSVFAVCFLPISVVHVFSALLSDKALINIYPLVCCIEYVYYAIIPILFVFTNKSLKRSTCKKKSQSS